MELTYIATSNNTSEIERATTNPATINRRFKHVVTLELCRVIDFSIQRNVCHTRWGCEQNSNWHHPHFYQPRTCSAREGNVFTGVCDSIQRKGEGRLTPVQVLSEKVLSRSCLGRMGGYHNQVTLPFSPLAGPGLVREGGWYPNQVTQFPPPSPSSTLPWLGLV